MIVVKIEIRRILKFTKAKFDKMINHFLTFPLPQLMANFKVGEGGQGPML
jgi:hypothetical protein